MKNKEIFVRNLNDAIKIVDDSQITFEQYQKILYKFNHLGYNFPNEDFVREFLKRDSFLNPDQSKVVLEVLGIAKPVERYSKEQIERDNKKAIEIFGTTEILRKAGYLLIDGSLLDFSEGQSYRTLDHRSIGEALEESLGSDYDYSLPLITFVAYGNIRLQVEKDYCMLEMSKQPTDAQKRIISSIIRSKDEVQIDISNGEGQVVNGLSYCRPLIMDVMNDINSYFEKIA